MSSKYPETQPLANAGEQIDKANDWSNVLLALWVAILWDRHRSFTNEGNIATANNMTNYEVPDPRGGHLIAIPDTLNKQIQEWGLNGLACLFACYCRRETYQPA